MEPHSFQLKDRHGNPHSYEVFPHTASEADAMATRLMATASPAVIDLILGISMDQEIEGGKVFGELLACFDGPMIQSLLSKTARDGKDLSQRTEYDAAYTGNRGELYAALYKIVGVSDLIPFGSIMSAVGVDPELLSKLKGSLTGSLGAMLSDMGTV